MVLSGKFILISVKPYHSNKSGKDYSKLSLCQDDECISVLTEDRQFIDSVEYPLYLPYDVELHYNTQYGKFSLVSMVVSQ